MAVIALGLITCRLFDRLQQIVHLGEDGFLELRCVGDGNVQGSYSSDWRIQMLEELGGNPGGDFGPEPARQLILVSHDDSVGPFDLSAMAGQSYGAIVRRSSTAT